MLDLQTACTIATSIVHSKLDYCNSLFLNIDITQIFRMLPPMLSLKPQNTTTSLLFSKNSTGLKYLNDKNTKQYHSPIIHFNSLSLPISSQPNLLVGSTTIIRLRTFRLRHFVY